MSREVTMGTQPRSGSAVQLGVMTGRVLRGFREQLGMTQKQLAPLIGLTRSSLNHREERDSAIPANVAASVLAITAAKRAGELSNLPQKTKLTWRDSIRFK